MKGRAQSQTEEEMRRAETVRQELKEILDRAKVRLEKTKDNLKGAKELIAKAKKGLGKSRDNLEEAKKFNFYQKRRGRA